MKTAASRYIFLLESESGKRRREVKVGREGEK
jgi:hypothetical protein